MNNINIGCGYKAIPDCTANVDKMETDITTHVHDLDVMPWPFGDDEFDNAYALDIFEHVRGATQFMDECHRILKPGAHLYIRTSWFMSENSYRDPTHVRFCTLETFDFYDRSTDLGKKYQYSDRLWSILDRGVDGQELVFELEKI